jgi:hypothetical protein
VEIKSGEKGGVFTRLEEILKFFKKIRIFRESRKNPTFLEIWASLGTTLNKKTKES